MSENNSIGSRYIQFLIDNQYWPKYYSYAITDHPGAYVDTDQYHEMINGKKVKIKKKVKDLEVMWTPEIGYTCSLPIKLEVVNTYTRMITFKVLYFAYEETFNVYAPMNVSPDEFYNRVQNSLNKLFKKIKTGHEQFQDFKDYFKEKESSTFAKIGEAFTRNTVYKDWIKLRTEHIDEEGHKLCYCGHTFTCECGDPDIKTFEESVNRKALDPNDPQNGWKSVE